MLLSRLHFLILVAAATCILLAPAPSAVASDSSARNPSHSFHGFYAGGLVGPVMYNSELNDAGNSADGLAATGLSNGVFVGSGTMYNQIYYALEGNVGYHNADFSENLGANNVEGDFKETYGASARIGGLFARNVLAYFRAGWQEVNADVSDNTGWSEDQRFNGVRLGLGMEYQTNQNVFIRSEYSYTLYDEETLTGGAADYEIDPDAGLFQLGIGFRF